MIGLRQFDYFWFWGFDVDCSFLGLLVSKTLGTNCSSCNDSCGASARIIADMLSFRPLSTWRLQKQFCYLVGLVTRIKICQLVNASTIPFPRRSAWATRLGLALKCTRPFALIVAIINVTERGSSCFFLADWIVFKRFLGDHWSYRVSKLILIPAFCVLSFLNNTSKEFVKQWHQGMSWSIVS